MEKKLLILGLLRQHQMHGYQLYDFIENGLASCTDLKKPTAYYLLNKMAEDGWVTEESMREGNRPPRRVYRLTERGEAEFQRLLRASLSAKTPAFFPDDIGLAFLDILKPEEAQTLLLMRRTALLKEIETARSAPAHQGSLQLVIDHQLHHLASELDWLDQVLARLQTPTRV
jgi:DNA-binding PadR family transcriptional regulator